MSNEPAAARFEYEFVRFDCAMTGVPSAAVLESYQETVRRFAGDGWRLVQIFAPATSYGAPFWELIFERPVSAESS